MSRVKIVRSITVESLCAFTEADQILNTSDTSKQDTENVSVTKPQPQYMSIKMKEVEAYCDEAKEENKDSVDKRTFQDYGRVSSGGASIEVGNEACTPNPAMISQNGTIVTDSKRYEAAKKVAALVMNPSAMKTKNQLQSSQIKGIKSSSVKSTAGTPNFVQENQPSRGRSWREEDLDRFLMSNPKI
ncbi:protein TPX2 [Quillaja saponaria]|uniref:Protein TPX2 n=1 Tax=Quillaja saponaria TaxID=32244 RepID=A0AAD7QHE4_QUISA|nr:protein TPX2 [Quillaja saponaria]